MGEEVKKSRPAPDPNSAKFKLGQIAAKAYSDAIEAKARGEMVGWCASNFPVEIPETLGLYVCYPENQAAKNLVYKTAYLMDTHQDASMAASMAKYYAAEVCNEIAAKAVQIHGGYGFIKDYKVERMYRDCRVFTIYEGTSQVQQMVIAGKLLKK